jgi:hypothetical protein
MFYAIKSHMFVGGYTGQLKEDNQDKQTEYENAVVLGNTQASPFDQMSNVDIISY